MKEHIHFRVDTRLAALLAETYRSSEAALKELIDNAWDADAEKVQISLPQQLTNDPILIEDDGTGMTYKEIENEYLVVANDRRSRKGEHTVLKNRKIKGRKGIGKFAGLMAADEMIVETWARGTSTRLHLDKRFVQQREIDLESIDLPFTTEACDLMLHGTKVTLSSLNQHLSFPRPEKLKQILVLEYGRTADFKITVNGESLDIEDIPGQTFDEVTEIEGIGNVRLRFTIADGRQRLKQSGIVFRVDNKIVGRPGYLGLEEDDTIPRKLLGKIYGEIEADALRDDITADWGAIIENSMAYQQVATWAQSYVKERVSATFTKEISLAKARLHRKINARIERLPEHRRVFAQRALERVLQKFYGETEERIEVVVSVVLDALEHDEYWTVLKEIEETSRSDVVAIAQSLDNFGLVDIAVIGRQATARLKVLDELDTLISDPGTLESALHKAFENNLWLLGHSYFSLASNKTLAKILEEYTNKKYFGDKAKERPDLFLVESFAGPNLLIEFKRPSHKLTRSDESQAQQYRDQLSAHFRQIEVLVLGGARHSSMAMEYTIQGLRSSSYAEVIGKARSRIQWLLKDLAAQ